MVGDSEAGTLTHAAPAHSCVILPLMRLAASLSISVEASKLLQSHLAQICAIQSDGVKPTFLTSAR